MSAAIPLSSARKTPFWLSYGFRPFFFLGSLAMGLSVLAWIPLYMGDLQLPTLFAPRDWHIHMLLFGAVPAIVAGFALTAVSNWTGRPPVSGKELLALVLLWLAGQLAVSASALIGGFAAMAIDAIFLFALAAVFAREVMGGQNYRNLRVVALVVFLGLANIGFHLESLIGGMADYSIRIAIAVILLMIMLIGGRIMPAFTRNWLMARGAKKLPASFSKFDGITVIVSVLTLLCWVVVPAALPLSALMLVAAALNIARLYRWCGWQTRSEPLLFFLHLSYATLPLGFVFVALSILLPDVIDPASSVHVWTVGSIGTMTLAVMMRAGRGHSGRSLQAGKLEIVLFSMLLIGLLARICAPMVHGALVPGLHVAGLAWAIGFIGFAVSYARMLLLPQPMKF